MLQARLPACSARTASSFCTSIKPRCAPATAVRTCTGRRWWARRCCRPCCWSVRRPVTRNRAWAAPFAWTAGRQLFKWFASLGLDEATFRSRVYMAAVCRCFPGKRPTGGDRVRAAGDRRLQPMAAARAELAAAALTNHPRGPAGHHTVLTRTPARRAHRHAAAVSSRPASDRCHPAAASVGRIPLAAHRAGQNAHGTRARADRGAPGVVGAVCAHVRPPSCSPPSGAASYLHVFAAISSAATHPARPAVGPQAHQVHGVLGPPLRQRIPAANPCARDLVVQRPPGHSLPVAHSGRHACGRNQPRAARAGR